MRHKKKDLLQKEHIVFLDEDQATDPFDILNETWDDLPYELDVEERASFIELTERLIKSYYKSDSAGLYSDDLTVN